METGLVLLSIRFFARRDEFLGSRIVKLSDAGAVQGEDCGDGEPAVGGDLVATGFWGLFGSVGGRGVFSASG